MNAGMLAEMLESIELPSKSIEIQANTMEKQSLLMRRCAGGDVGKHWQPSKSIESTNKYNGKTRLNNAGMLAEMLESIEHF